MYLHAFTLPQMIDTLPRKVLLTLCKLVSRLKGELFQEAVPIDSSVVVPVGTSSNVFYRAAAQDAGGAI